MREKEGKGRERERKGEKMREKEGKGRERERKEKKERKKKKRKGRKRGICNKRENDHVVSLFIFYLFKNTKIKFKITLKISK